MMIKNIFYTVSFLIIASFTGVLGYNLYIANFSKPVAPDNLYTNLMNVNPAFLAGERLAEGNALKEAIQEYERALLSVRSKPEEALIKNKIATAKAASGDIVGAIELSKEVAADEAYGSISRAYAVRFMGQSLFSPSLAAERDLIRETIFKDEPYRGFASTTDDSVSYRNLFDYASSLYPLASTELRSARWYADAVYALKQKPSLGVADKETIQEYLYLISQKVKRADADIARIKNTANENLTLPETFVLKALVNTRVLRAGETYEGMVPPESVYEEALSYIRLMQMLDGEASLRYGYAVYLARQYGEDRKAEVEALLSDFYSSERFAGTPISYIFKDEKANDAVVNENIRLLASTSPAFKAFLQEGGWEF